MHVPAVVDQLAGDPGLERRSDKAGLAVMQRRHRVEQMGGVAGAGADACERLLVGWRRSGPSRRSRRPALSVSINGSAPGSSGAIVTIRSVSPATATQALEQRRVGREHVRRVLGAAAAGRQERPLEV